MSNKTKLSLTIMSLTATFLASTLTACGNSKWHEVAGTPKNTGNATAETQTAKTRATDLTPGETVRTTPDTLILKTDETGEGDGPRIDFNTKLKVEKTEPSATESSGMVKVVTTGEDPQSGWVPAKYLEKDGPTQPAADKYFMIQNIATEKVRVYQNCATVDEAGKCHHKLVLETDMVAGEDTPTKDRRSILGSYTITSWHKFYEDNKKNFPSFFDPNYPELPKPGASIDQWMSKDLLPKGKGAIRGSFGWYTAKIGPDASEQWTHGTFGWGEDAGEFIKIAKDSRVDLRSAGCTRVENQAIAFMREILVERSKVYKIYAKESLKDKGLKRYENSKAQKWSWILTTDGVRSTTAKSAAKHHTSKTSKDVLDEGSYSLNQKPTVASGNVYKIKADSFKGTFLVDEGRLANYEHPKEIRVGGYKEKTLPAVVTEAATKTK